MLAMGALQMALGIRLSLALAVQEEQPRAGYCWGTACGHLGPGEGLASRLASVHLPAHIIPERGDWGFIYQSDLIRSSEVTCKKPAPIWGLTVFQPLVVIPWSDSTALTWVPDENIHQRCSGCLTSQLVLITGCRLRVSACDSFQAIKALLSHAFCASYMKYWSF